MRTKLPCYLIRERLLSESAGNGLPARSHRIPTLSFYIDDNEYTGLSIFMDSLNTTFAALADPTRRSIVAHLKQGEATVNELVEQFDLTQPTISSHIKVLEKAGLVTRERVAQTRPCRLNPSGLRSLAQWLKDYEQFWEATIDHFVEHAEETNGTR